MSLVFQNIDPPTPSPPGECVPPAYVGGGGHTRRAERGVGGQYFGRRETQDCPLTVIISLRLRLLSGILPQYSPALVTYPFSHKAAAICSTYCTVPIKDIVQPKKRGVKRGTIPTVMTSHTIARRCFLGTLKGLLFLFKLQKTIFSVQGQKNVKSFKDNVQPKKRGVQRGTIPTVMTSHTIADVFQVHLKG